MADAVDVLATIEKCKEALKKGSRSSEYLTNLMVAIRILNMEIWNEIRNNQKQIKRIKSKLRRSKK